MYANKHNLRLDPALDGAAGGAAEAGSPAGGAAPAEAFDATKFVPREDFERIQSDYSQFRQAAEQRFQDYDSRLPKPEKQEKKEDKEPDAESGEYDFSKPGEFQRYQRDLTQYHLRNQFAEHESRQSEAQEAAEREKNVGEIVSSAAQRDKAYAEANPSYTQTLKGASINVPRPVGLAVMDSEYSAQIKEYLAKNPQKSQELREIAQGGRFGMEKALRMVGRIEAMFETQESTVQTKKTAASAMPTAGGFGGSKPSGAKQPSKEEIFDKWNS